MLYEATVSVSFLNTFLCGDGLFLFLLVEALKRICCRCGAEYSVSQTGKHTRKEECNYHFGKAVKNKGEYTIVFMF